MNTDKTTQTASETQVKFPKQNGLIIEPRVQYTLNDCGCYVDSVRGIYAIDAIVDFAESHGFKVGELPPEEKYETCFKSRFAGSEFAGDIEDECDDCMNAQYAVEGAYWGRSEQGDWGLWQIDAD